MGRTPSERFWSRVNIGEETDCWAWIGGVTKDGYGTIEINKKLIGVHRYSWEIANNQPVPEGMHILHKCDNPPCVNPLHLFAGSRSDNMRDMVAKGRKRGGINHRGT